MEVQLAKTKIDDIERDLINPWLAKLPGETDEDAEIRIRSEASDAMRPILEYGPQYLPADLLERAKTLLQAARDPHSLSLLRAADFAQAHKRREEEKNSYKFGLSNGHTSRLSTLDLMARITLEYGVPHKTMVELSQAIYTDIEEQRSADRIISLSEQEERKASAKKT
jgi:hypothetical protein